MSGLLERLKTDILVADGAMGTLLYANGLDNCYETYNLTHPEKVLPFTRLILRRELMLFRQIPILQNVID